jgi:hypothetical protein
MPTNGMKFTVSKFIRDGCQFTNVMYFAQTIDVSPSTFNGK